MSAVIGRLYNFIFMKEASGDQYMWFDYIQNSIGTCFFICVCMQKSARKIHSKN